jgi:hypothetical protein
VAVLRRCSDVKKSKPVEAVGFEKAAALNPEEPAAFYLLARALDACYREAEAQQALPRVKELNAGGLKAVPIRTEQP